MLAASVTAAGLLAVPAADAAAPPWAFDRHTMTLTLQPNEEKVWTPHCFTGSRPVSGGFTSTNAAVYRTQEYATPADGTYRLSLYNNSGFDAQVELFAYCVRSSSLSGVTSVSQDFVANSSAYAGGVVYCPAGTSVLSGGADWYSQPGSQGRRSITSSGPTKDGGGWLAAGRHTGDKLAVEVHCAPDADLASATVRFASSQVAPADETYSKATIECPSGTRTLTGGTMIHAPAGGFDRSIDRGFTYTNNLRSDSLEGLAKLRAGNQVTAVAICVPVSTPSVTITSGPPSLTNNTSPTVSYETSDSAGELLGVTCELDGRPETCRSGSWQGVELEDGSHTFIVKATNASEQVATAWTTWRVDTAVPTVADTAGESITGPWTVTFSEQVTGVSTSSLQVRADDSSGTVPGTVTTSVVDDRTVAAWRPSAPLVPGRWYTVTLSEAIADQAGNQLTATFFRVRAATTVENSSPALQEYWDSDSSSSASGGKYISSRSSGSAASLTFTAASGQRASVYGVRQRSGGYADIYVDGAKKATVSFFASSTAWRAKLFTSAALTAGTHTVRIVPKGTRPSASTGSWVALDYVTAGSTTYQETALQQSFRRTTSTSASGGSYDVVDHVTSNDTGSKPSYRLTFTGTGVKLYATKTPNSGTARVYVDGVYKATVNLYAASTTYKSLVYSASLSAGTHTIQVYANGTTTGSKSAVALDYVKVT